MELQHCCYQCRCVTFLRGSGNGWDKAEGLAYNWQCMKRLLVSALHLTVLAAGWFFVQKTEAQPSAATGNGKLKFRTIMTSAQLPAEAQAVLKGAHGGFAVDMRPGKGETYFALKGAGIIQISADMKSARMLPTPLEMKDTNMHNANLWHAPDGNTYLLFPGNESGKIFVTTLDGKLMGSLGAPAYGTDMGHPGATDYFNGRGGLIPTDIEQLDGLLYVTTGYSNLDYVLTAKASWSPFKLSWNDLSFGGKGMGPGQFMTGHGITNPPGTKRLDIADRPNSEIDRFTKYGQYISTLKLPLGSLPCDIYYMGKYAVIGALDGPDRSKGAPIYILEDDKLVSTLMPKEDLGLPLFTHVHNAVIREVNGKLYVIAQAWNPGDFAIFEQVTN